MQINRQKMPRGRGFLLSWLPGALLCLLPVFAVSALAAEYSELGADSCLPCHAQGMPRDATPIFMTPHGSREDPRSPFAGLQCEACHGPGKSHVEGQQRGENVLPSIVFGSDSITPPEQQNQVCLECHDNGGRLGWPASAHADQDVSCASCHQVHAESDPVFDPLLQQQACFECHQDRRADSHRASSHPLRFGTMACSDCHDPHNGHNDFLLKEETVVETCYDCHAEKRGPFLWEHAPASENCSLCHQPHGSNHPALLTRRPPLLCQQCHSPAGHPSIAFTPDSTADDFSNRFLLGRSCLNCHSRVHGSNHPSGSTLHR